MISWSDILLQSVHVATYWIYTFNSTEPKKIWMTTRTDLVTSKSTFYLRSSPLRLAEDGIKKRRIGKRSAKNRSIKRKRQVVRMAIRQERERERRERKEHFP
jgi:hypothetical protein